MTGPGAEERMEIYELYARYSWALDTGDTDGYAAFRGVRGWIVLGIRSIRRETMRKIIATGHVTLDRVIQPLGVS